MYCQNQYSHFSIRNYMGVVYSILINSFRKTKMRIKIKVGPSITILHDGTTDIKQQTTTAITKVDPSAPNRLNGTTRTGKIQRSAKIINHKSLLQWSHIAKTEALGPRWIKTTNQSCRTSGPAIRK